MDCYDRNEEGVRLWRHFQQGKNVLMLAPRRIGKTVLLNRLREESEAQGFHSIVLDVEGYRDEKAFFQQMCSSIQEEIGVGQAVVAAFTERMNRIVNGAETQGDWRNILLHTDWTLFADHLLAQLEADKDGRPWLILVDEIPIFTMALLEEEDGPKKARDFLYTLRNLRQKHRQVLWLYTGSIGLDTVARRYGFEGALVDMEIFPLLPFSPETAAGFLDHIAAKSRCRFSQEATARIIARLGWLAPYYLEKIAEAACDQAAGQCIEADGANRAADSLLDLCRRTYWSTWREHLEKNFPEPQRTHLFTLLAEVARGPAAGTGVDALLLAMNRAGDPIGATTLRDLLDTLEADGYLSAEGNRACFRFRMTLLKEWWLRYVVVRG